MHFIKLQQHFFFVQAMTNMRKILKRVSWDSDWIEDVGIGQKRRYKPEAEADTDQPGIRKQNLSYYY